MNGEGAARSKTAPNHHQGTNTHNNAGRNHSTGDGRQEASDREADLRLYLHTVFGDAAGWCHIGIGCEAFITDKGKVDHKRFVPGAVRWPDEADGIVKVILAESELADVWVTPYLSESGEAGRAKGAAVSRQKVHSDIDKEPFDDEKAQKLRELGGFAVNSGTPGHAHPYVELSELTMVAEHEALCRGLGAYIGGADTAKCSDNDLLRPPGTFNHKNHAWARHRGEPEPDPTPVRWLIKPSGQRWTVSELADKLGANLDNPNTTKGKTKAEGNRKRAETEEFDLNQDPALKAAVHKNSGDRSSDTYG